MTISLLNTFCLRYDLIFIEMGRVKGREVYWFLDSKSNRRYYTSEEIESKIS